MENRQQPRYHNPKPPRSGRWDGVLGDTRKHKRHTILKRQNQKTPFSNTNNKEVNHVTPHKQIEKLTFWTPWTGVRRETIKANKNAATQ